MRMALINSTLQEKVLLFWLNEFGGLSCAFIFKFLI